MVKYQYVRIYRVISDVAFTRSGNPVPASLLGGAAMVNKSDWKNQLLLFFLQGCHILGSLQTCILWPDVAPTVTLTWWDIIALQKAEFCPEEEGTSPWHTWQLGTYIFLTKYNMLSSREDRPQCNVNNIRIFFWSHRLQYQQETQWNVNNMRVWYSGRHSRALDLSTLSGHP